VTLAIIKSYQTTSLWSKFNFFSEKISSLVNHYRQSGHCFRVAYETWLSWLEISAQIVSDAAIASWQGRGEAAIACLRSGPCNNIFACS
jgi:hypothetical protein